MYEKEIEVVDAAVAALRSESDRTLIAELEDEQAAAATGLEHYGITKTVFERFLTEKNLPRSTRSALKNAIKAVVAIYTK